MLDTQSESLTQKRSRAGKLGAAKVNAARTAARRKEVAQRAARKRWGLCRECGQPGARADRPWLCGDCLERLDALADFLAREQEMAFAIHFAGLDGPGDAPPETTP